MSTVCSWGSAHPAPVLGVPSLVSSCRTNSRITELPGVVLCVCFSECTGWVWWSAHTMAGPKQIKASNSSHANGSPLVLKWKTPLKKNHYKLKEIKKIQGKVVGWKEETWFKTKNKVDNKLFYTFGGNYIHKKVSINQWNGKIQECRILGDFPLFLPNSGIDVTEIVSEEEVTVIKRGESAQRTRLLVVLESLSQYLGIKLLHYLSEDRLDKKIWYHIPQAFLRMPLWK